MFLIRLKAGDWEHKFIRKCLLRPQSESAEEWFSGPARNKKKEGLRDCTGFTFETWKIQLFFFIYSLWKEIVIEIATVTIISD